jgi:hypothetical protein
LACIVPTTNPGGNPVMDVPGYIPREPLTAVNPVLVTALAPNTPKDAAVPKF